MRKRLILTFLFIIILSLTSCKKTKGEFILGYDDATYKINLSNKTICDETYTYKYKFSGYKLEYKIKIIYPDGSIYNCKYDGNYKTESWDGQYNPIYASSKRLSSIIVGFAPTQKPKLLDQKSIIIGIITIIIGVVNIIYPDRMWYLEYGWACDGGEPSDTVLILNRLLGIVLTIIGIVLIVFGINIWQ
jgi:hypothetical protein